MDLQMATVEFERESSSLVGQIDEIEVYFGRTFLHADKSDGN
jgi:hypothetical protein